jgi:hypothetical protein
MKRLFRSADRRLVGALVVSGLLLVPLGIFGGSALAHGGPSAAQYQYKVKMCHHTGSRWHPWQMINISNRAVFAHLRHHDVMPPCPIVAPTAHHHGHGHGHDHGASFFKSHGRSHGDDDDGGGGGGGHGHHGNS